MFYNSCHWVAMTFCSRLYFLLSDQFLDNFPWNRKLKKMCPKWAEIEKSENRKRKTVPSQLVSISRMLWWINQRRWCSGSSSWSESWGCGFETRLAQEFRSQQSILGDTASLGNSWFATKNKSVERYNSAYRRGRYRESRCRPDVDPLSPISHPRWTSGSGRNELRLSVCNTMLRVRWFSQPLKKHDAN